MATYVIGDIHGCFDEWMELHNKIETKDNDAKYIFVGDIIDRGPKTGEMLDWAINNISENGKYRMVIGNHELMKIEQFRSQKSEYELYKCIGFSEDDIITTIDCHYGFIRHMDNCGVRFKELDKYIDWFKTLPFYIDTVVNDTRFIIAHADIPYEAVLDNNKLVDNKSLSNKAKQFIVWDRGIDDFTKVKDAILVHGHTPTLDISGFKYDTLLRGCMLGKIAICLNRINIDCGLVFKDMNSNLAALCLDNLEVTYLYER